MEHDGDDGGDDAHGYHGDGAHRAHSKYRSDAFSYLFAFVVVHTEDFVPLFYSGNVGNSL